MKTSLLILTFMSLTVSSLANEDLSENISKVEMTSQENEITDLETLEYAEQKKLSSSDEIALDQELFEEQNQQTTVLPRQILTSSLNFKEIFLASPVIYTILILMSISSVVIWLYSLFTFRTKDIMPKQSIEDIRSHLIAKNYDDAAFYCQKKNTILTRMIASGINSRHYGTQLMFDSMKSEGKRATISIWQKLSILNDVVLIAPMLGLLGTVIGMFYGFYNINRSMDSIASLFDGLGIAVGTTVAGLIVAILAMIFYTTLKYRLTKILSLVENEAYDIGNLIDIKSKKK
jgi:biopolymer transport protein ExbB/TolQ